MFWDCCEKALLQGVATGAISVGVMGQGRFVVIPALNKQVPLWLFGTVVGAASSVINDFIHDNMFPHIHASKKAEDELSMIMAAGIGAGTFFGTLYVLNQKYPQSMGTYNTLLIGALGEVVGAWGYNFYKH